jgi:chemotaxis protein CheC
VHDVTELEEDTLAEIGNVIINACMISLARLVDAQLTGELPRVHVCSGPALLGDQTNGEAMLIARIGMQLADTKVTGCVLMLMDTASVRSLVREIERAFQI